MAENRRFRLPKIFAGSSFQAYSDSVETESRLIENTPVGRILGDNDEQAIAARSEQLFQVLGLDQSLQTSAQAFGVVTYRLVKEMRQKKLTVTPLSPGWSYSAGKRIDAPYFIIELRALLSGPWAGTLEAGGEHLYDELNALINAVQSRMITPIFIDNSDELFAAPRSFQFVNSLARMRRIVPGTVSDLAITFKDPLAPSPSPLFDALFDYQQRTREVRVTIDD